MNRNETQARTNTTIQGKAVRSCELRLERSTKAADGTERVEYICGASGGPEDGHVLAVSGEDLSPMVAICNACPIPDALEVRQSCLNLVPVRRFPGGKRELPVIQSQTQTATNHEPADTYFPCRWFYTLYGQNQPRDTQVCKSCQHWFPRPPRELIPEYWPETQKMLRVVNGEESTLGPPTGFSPAARRPLARTWWQRILDKLIP
jgi:hypothetical protein